MPPFPLRAASVPPEPPSRTRSVDILLRRTFTRLIWVLSGAMAALGLVQFGLPTLPHSQGWISLGLAGILALLAVLPRRLRPSRAALDLFWLLAMTAVSACLARRAWVDPAPLRPFILLVALPVAGVFIQGRAWRPASAAWRRPGARSAPSRA